MSSSDPRPIGVFDSGIGGLTVVAALRRRLPALPIVYLGDTARLPYGNKSAETVRRYTRRNVDFLLSQGVRGVVVACNTASALALDHLAARVPVWGVIEPGAEQAAAVSDGRVGVLATRATVASGAYERALRSARPELAVDSRPCPLFVPLVEEGWHDDPVTEQVARRYLEPLLAWQADTLVLGCTHYPLLRPLLQRVAGDTVTLVDSAEAVAETVAGALGRESGDRVEAAAGRGSLELFVSDGESSFGGFAGRILGESEVSLRWVDVTAPGDTIER
ncbi:MAG: glutamate racemase [Acidobacteriota bacterium]